MAKWRYDVEQREELGERRAATLESLVPLYIAGALGNPRLEVIEDATWGTQVHVRLHAGEVDPRTGRRVEAVVDEDEAFEVGASHPEGSDDVLSLRDPRRLVAAIAGGSRLVLRVPVRRQGRVKIAFGIEGLDLERLRVPPPG